MCVAKGVRSGPGESSGERSLVCVLETAIVVGGGRTRLTEVRSTTKLSTMTGSLEAVGCDERTLAISGVGDHAG